MGKKFGVIALKNADISNIELICNKLERDSWFYNYKIVRCQNGWISIFDENLEWGNIEVYIEFFWEYANETILSVEYCDDCQVRYKIWHNRLYIAGSEGYNEMSIKAQRQICRKFANELNLSVDLVNEIFRVIYVEQSIFLMESILQCQLWRGEDWTEKEKIIPAECIEETYWKDYVKSKNKESIRIGNRKNDIFKITKAVTQKGSLMRGYGKYPVIYKRTDEKGIVSIIDELGNIVEKLNISEKKHIDYFYTYFVNDEEWIGFLSKNEGFILYKNNKVALTLSNIRSFDCTLSWDIFMLDEKSIFLDWSCFDLKSGVKKWEFPTPSKREYEKNLLLEKWKALPTNDIFTLVNLDQKKLQFSVVTVDGDIKNTVFLPISGEHYRVEIESKYIYFIQKVSINQENKLRVVLFDFNLNKVLETFIVIENILSYQVKFDSCGENFYIFVDDKVIKYCIISGKHKELLIKDTTIVDRMTSWGILNDDNLYIILKERELLVFDLDHGECIFHCKLRGYILEMYRLNSAEIMVIMSSIRNTNEIIMQKIVTY